MIRRLFHSLCAMSLSLCIFTIALWVRSYSIREDVSWQSAKRLTRFKCSAGEFLIESGPQTSLSPHVFRWAFPANDMAAVFSEAVGTGYLLGFGFGRTGDSARMDTDVIFPLWFVALLLILPLFLAWRDYRKRIGRCKKCGYDLRASKDRCPECGTPIAANA